MRVRVRTPMLIGVLMGLAVGVADAQDKSERRGWLGFSYSASDENGVETVHIDNVYPGSPAARAGVRDGDEVIRVNGQGNVASALYTLGLEPGDTVRLRVRRASERDRDLAMVAATPPRSITLRRNGTPQAFFFPQEEMEKLQRELEEGRDEWEKLFRDGKLQNSFRIDSIRFKEFFPEGFGRTLSLRADSLHRSLELMLRDSLGPRLGALAEEIRFLVPEAAGRTVITVGRRSVAGAEFEEMNPGLAAYFGTDEGALVLRVAPGTPAARAGLQPGDVVLEADDREVDSVDDLRNAVARAQGAQPRAVQLEVLRQGQRRDVDLRWE